MRIKMADRFPIYFIALVYHELNANGVRRVCARDAIPKDERRDDAQATDDTRTWVFCVRAWCLQGCASVHEHPTHGRRIHAR